MFCILFFCCTVFGASFLSDPSEPIEVKYENRKQPKQILQELEFQLTTWPNCEGGAKEQYDCEANLLLNAPWDPVRGPRFWIRWYEGLNEFNHKVKANDVHTTVIFNQSVESGDLSVIKFIVDYQNDLLQHTHQHNLMERYFRKYRLTQVSNVDPKLTKALNNLASDKFDFIIRRMLAIMISEYPVNHEFMKGPVTLNPTMPAEHGEVILRIFFSHFSRESISRFQLATYSTIQMLSVFRRISAEFNLDFNQFSRDLQPHHHNLLALLDMGLVKDEVLLDLCFNEIDWKIPTSKPTHLQMQMSVKQSSFLIYVHDRWPEWLVERAKTISMGTLLFLAWRHPKLIHFVNLPDKMPPIGQLIPTMQNFSFEKAEYLEVIIAKYGIQPIITAMAQVERMWIPRQRMYCARNFIILKMIVQEGDLDIQTVMKLFPKSSEDMPDWILWVMKRTGCSPDFLLLSELLAHGDDNDLPVFLLPQLENRK